MKIAGLHNCSFNPYPRVGSGQGGGGGGGGVSMGWGNGVRGGRGSNDGQGLSSLVECSTRETGTVCLKK